MPAATTRLDGRSAHSDSSTVSARGSSASGSLIRCRRSAPAVDHVSADATVHEQQDRGGAAHHFISAVPPS